MSAKNSSIARLSVQAKNILIRMRSKVASDILVKVRFLNQLLSDQKFSFKIYTDVKTSLWRMATFKDKVLRKARLCKDVVVVVR